MKIINYEVTLKDKETNETKILSQEFEEREEDDFSEWDVIEFMWEEGNYSCDCNRWIFFYPEERDVDFPCGNGRFELVKLKNKEEAK